MGLAKILTPHKAAILKKWFDLTVETYPADTANFLKRQKDPFANPVGGTTRKGLEGLLDTLLGDMASDSVRQHLDSIIRIRSVQDFTPSRATGFVFALKAVIRRALERHHPEQLHNQEFVALERRIDQMGLAAFDLYMQCREKIYALKADNHQQRIYRAMRRAKVITEEAEEPPPLKQNNH